MTAAPPPEAGEQSLEDIERQLAELQALRARKLAQAQVEPQAETAPIRKRPTTRRAAGPEPAHVQTGGGAVFKRSVTSSSGHVIGRDFVQVIEQMTVQGEDAKDATLALASYLHALATDLAGLNLGDIDASPDQTRQTPLQLADIYVPLQTTFKLPKRAKLAQAAQAQDPGEMLLAAGSRGDTRNKTPEFRSASAIEALATHPRLTLLGAPGSGKSTFGAHVLLCLAQAWQGRDKAEKLLGKTWTAGPLLPVRVVLRRFAESHAGSAKKLRAGDLWTFIGQDLHDGGWGDAGHAIKVVQRIAREHGALVLFDGLDECGDESRRQRVLAAVQDFMNTAGEKSRFLLTARPYAFPGGPNERKAVYQLAELDEAGIGAFIHAWYAALVKRGWQKAAAAQVKRDDLLGAYQRADLMPLASNPLLLTLMATLHSNRGRLPDDRVDLYDETINLLLLRWNKDVGADRALLAELDIPTLTLRHLRGALEKLAFEVHEANEGREGVADISEARLLRAFSPLLGNSLDKARQVVAFIERRAGLLLGLGRREGEAEDSFTFPHRTFQEFLAACHLHPLARFASECRRLADKAPEHWREVLPLAARLAQAERGAAAADELIGAQDFSSACAKAAIEYPDLQRAHLAGLMLREIGPVQLAQAHTSQAVTRRVRGWLAAALPLYPGPLGAPASHRVAMGHVLAALGDPRFDPQRLHLAADPMLGFVPVAADPAFCIGTRTADRERVQTAIGGAVSDDEINDATTPTPAFYIARYPVTVAQFRAYLQDSGLQPEDLDSLRADANRPVAWVSFHEALAYCGWLQYQLLHAPGLADWPLRAQMQRQGLQLSLPSELEWEKAARGGQSHQVFSWGDDPDPEQANIRATGILYPAAVGCFPANGYGLHDMLGNVLEWTRSLWTAADDGAANRYPGSVGQRRFEALDAGDDIMRLVRGGSWLNALDGARCAWRNWFHPDYRDDFLGFRVVLRSAPVS